MSVPDSVVKQGVRTSDRRILSRLAVLNPMHHIRKLGARFHIAMGLSSFVSSVMLIAMFIGLIPNQEAVLQQSRTALSEAIATFGSVLLREGDVSGLRYSLEFVVEQNPDIQGIELRRDRGGDYLFQSEAKRVASAESSIVILTDDVKVPLMQRGREWGALIFKFESSNNGSWLERYWNSPLFLIAFMGFACFPLFYLFLGKMLKELNPSQAVPSRVRSALDTIAEALLVLDSGGNIVLANAAFAQLTGMPPESLLGMPAGDLPWAAENQQEKPVWEDSLINATPTRHNKIGLTDASGHVRTFIVNCSPVFAADNQVGGVLISMDDVTQLEEQEILLRESMQIAEEASQAKSAFLSNMSHEIRTPMTAILGFTEVMRRNNGTSESERLDYLNTIANSGQHLLELINDVLDLSKVESGAMEVELLPCDCPKIAQEVVRVLQSKANEKHIELSIEVLTDFPDVIVADPSRLRQVITNLVGNAIKFTDSGSVLIRLSFMVQAVREQSRIRIDIVDSGIGMSEEQQGRIFEAFTQASASISRRFGGTGLGLSISRQLTEAMNGTLSVSSTEGVGSTFHVDLPVATEDFLLQSPEDILGSLNKVSIQTRVTWDLPASRILVVDDGPENRLLMSVVLGGLKLTVELAENGKEGLDAAVAAMVKEPYDLIFMDIQMPVMDGYEAVSQMRKAGIETPIVALTANAMKGFEASILEAGFSHYMVKPIDMDLLGDLLARQLGGTRREIEENVVADLDASAVPALESAPLSDANVEAIDVMPPTDVPVMPVDDFAGVVPVFSTLPVEISDFHEVVAQFIPRVQEEQLRLETAVQDDDHETVAQIGHWLRGSGGNVGYAGFADLCNELEECAHSNPARLPDLLEQIKIYTRRVLAGWHATPVPGEEVAVADTSADPVRVPSSDSILDAVVDMPADVNVEAVDVMPPADVPVIPVDDFAGVVPVFSTLPVEIRDFHEVVAQFIPRVQEEQLRLETAVQEGDYETVAQIGHWLRGSGGNVGYAGFADLCNELEECAHSNPARLPDLLDQIKIHTRQVLAGWRATPVPDAANR
ncbi:ATP-binding protein [Granulosicoccus antarcticus]|uniref:histidine kinase n=1 Tax=Granulosicoccus antarcticus IMCC3135 TaxID=1192854 RepID=A0A2Z2NIU3_9GAMM|nr:ATP-binding protein [Granulosicoccus antarcticus]ASJ70405.1 Sensory/regulatory protein RpfC [Granulosicoccus antarcticus IMCC3135]